MPDELAVCGSGAGVRMGAADRRSGSAGGRSGAMTPVAVVASLVEDMEAAAIEAADQASAGPGRVFAASRAIRAGEIRQELIEEEE
ncbi:hypothetical protein [Nocardia carnea]|uniref:hypothetical protein n=1 Tax=Nocardia carnea TaxID=37328 RepID=UPI0024578224|nr:hypothetical protein [Nocardia carnea]